MRPSRWPALFLALLLASGCVREPAQPSHRPQARAPLPTLVPPAFLKDVAGQAYTLVADPSLLPPDIAQALATHLGQSVLHIAGPAQPFNSSCLEQPDLPRHRLVGAAIGSPFAVVQFESGGFAVVSTVLVLSRGPSESVVRWSNPTASHRSSPQAFLAALRAGALWGTLDSPALPVSTPGT